MNKRQIEVVQKVVEILRKFLNSTRIIIFGSRVKESNQKHSDFDFALDCPKPSCSIERKIREEIEKIAGCIK